MIYYFSPTSGEISYRFDKQSSVFKPTVAEAKEHWQAGDIEDCNIAFQRLATQFDFDVPAALTWYREQA